MKSFQLLKVLLFVTMLAMSNTSWGQASRTPYTILPQPIEVNSFPYIEEGFDSDAIASGTPTGMQGSCSEISCCAGVWYKITIDKQGSLFATFDNYQPLATSLILYKAESQNITETSELTYVSSPMNFCGYKSAVAGDMGYNWGEKYFTDAHKEALGNDYSLDWNSTYYPGSAPFHIPTDINSYPDEGFRADVELESGTHYLEPATYWIYAFNTNQQTTINGPDRLGGFTLVIDFVEYDPCPDGFTCNQVTETICSSESFTTQNGQVITETSSVQETIGTIITTYNITVDGSINCCPDGYTCNVVDVIECSSPTYTTPFGNTISETGSILDEDVNAQTRTVYNVTFDRTEVNSDIYQDGLIAETGLVTYQANTNATGVLSFNKAQDFWVNLNALQDDLNGTNRSVFMWVKSEADVVSDDQILFAINTGSGGNVALLKIDNDGENLELFDGSDNQSASFDMGDEQWHYVGYTYDAATTETVIYVDGIENDRFNDNQSTANDSQYSLGQEFDNANDSDHMNGDMAEISVWAEVLTGAEIREAMRSKINDGHPKYANLVGYYSVFGDCNDATDVLKDHSGKGNDGVMVNNFTVDFKNVQSIPGFNAIDWYENISWKKDGSEVSTAPAYTFDVATGSYEFIATRNFIQSSDSWTLTTSTNATTVDQIADETLCSDDPITRTVSASAVNYLDFEESDNNYIDVSGVVNDLVGTSRSIFMWVNKESNVASGDNDILFSIHADNGTESVTNFYIRDNEKLAIYDGADAVDGGSALANDTWYFVGYTYDAASFETKVYLNGAVIETFTEEMPVASGNTAYLGMELDDNGPSDYFDGKMTEITIWNESLTEEQVAALMATAPAHNAANLVSYYGTFKTIADNRLLDLTANGNDGLVSHNSIIVTTEEAELTDYNATANYIFSWKKEGTEFDTDAVGNITIDEGTTNYSVTYGTPLFQKTDEFNLSYTNLIPTEPTDKTAGALGSVIFEVDEIAGATYRWFKKEPVEELVTEETGFPENPGLLEDIKVDGANLYVATRKGLAISDDDGFSWSIITESSGIPNSNIGEIEVDGDKYYLVTQNGGLSISIDAGQTWTTTVPRENGFPASLNPKEVKKVGETLYVATESGLAISSDDGQTWSVVDREKTGFSVSGSLTDVFIAGNSIYLTSEWRSGVGPGGISISEDGGSTWTTTAPGENGFPTSDDQLAVAALGDNIFVGTKTSGLAISSDGGQTWAIKTILKEGYPNTNRVNVLFIEDNNIYAGTGDGLFQSTDFGNTWTVLLGSDPIYALYATDEVIYTGNSQGKLFKLDVASELTDEPDNTAANQIQGASTHRLTINNLSLDQSGLEYFVEVSKDGCTQTSDDATLTVVEAPIIEELSPASGSTDVEIDENLEIEYNDRIELGTGTMRVYDYATDELIRTFSTEVSVGAGDHELGLNSRGEIRSIAMNLEYNTQYYVLVDEGVVLDDDDNPSLAITDKDFWTFKTVCEPLVLTQPEDQTGFIGQSATFSVPEVEGATYQWRKNGAEARTINSDNGLSINIPYQVFKSGDLLYVASENGLGVSSDGGETFSIKNVVNGFPISSFTGVAESNSTIYIATSSATAFNSAVKLETQSQVLSTKTFQSEHNGVVVSSVREHNGNIYFGTNYGLYVSTDQGDNFSKTSQDASFNAQKITSLEFYNGSIYLGTQSDGLAISTDNGATFERKTVADGLGSNAINDVFALSGKLYVATENGLSISSDNGDSFVNKSTTDGLENDRVLTVYGSSGMLYVGTAGGLSISTDGGNSFSNSKSPTELASNAVYGVDEFEGNLYFSAFDGSNGFIYVLESGLSDGTDSAADNYIIGSNTHELTISNLTEDFDQTEYFVSVTKAECEETSDLVTLSIVDVPIITRVTPVKGSSDLEKDVNITLSFNRAVTLGAGSISVLNYVTDEEVLDINVNDASIINGNTVVLPTASLSLSTKYYLKIDEGVVLDGSEVANLAVDTKDTYSFTTKIDFFTAAAEDQVISLGDDAGLELSTGVQGTLQWYQMKSEDETLNVEQVNLNGASIQGNDFEDGKFYYLDGTTENQNRLFIYDLESESIESTTIDYGGRSYLNAVKVKGKLVIVYRTDASNSGVNYLYISTDGGKTFKEKQYPEINQFRPSDFVITDSGTFYTFVRMPSDYINPNAFGLFKSVDFGGTFEFIDLTDVADGQSFSSFTSVAVSQNEEQVFVVNASAIYSLNSGQDFTRNSTKFQSADFIGNELYVTLAPRVAYHVPDPTNLLARTKIISSTKTVYEPLLVGDQLMFPYNQSNFGLIREDLTTKTEFVNKLSLESTFGTKAVVNEGKSAYKNYLYLVDNSSRSLVKVKFADIIEGSTTANLSLSDIEESGHYFAIMEYLGTYGYSSFSDVLVAPTLVSVTPTDDATDVSISPALSAEFNIPVQEGSGSILIKRVDNDQLADLIGVTSDVSFDDNIISFQLDLEALENNTEYYVEIAEGVIESLEGVAFAGITDKTTWSFTTAASGAQLAIASLSPTDDAVDLSAEDLNTTIPNFNKFWITFSEGAKYGNTSAEYRLYTAADDQLVASQTLISTLAGPPIGNTTAGFGFYNYTLEPGTSYYILMDAGMYKSVATDEEFSGISDKTAWNFTTKALDAEPLEVTSTFPGATRDALLDFPYVNLTFGETTAAGSGAITIYRADDNSVFETIDVSEFTFSNGGTPKRVQVPLTNGWEVGTAYYIQYPAGLITSLDGSKEIEEINDKTSFAFKAERFNENIITNFFPATGSTTYEADSEDELVIYTSVSVGLERDPLGSFRIYKAANDELVKTIEYDGENDRDLDYGDEDNFIKFEFDDDELEPGTEYYVLVNDGFIISYEEGLYHVGISDPTTWRFTTLEEPTTPTLFSINPGPNATDVPVSANIALNYSENVQANPDAVNNVVLYDADNNVVETFASNTLSYSGVKVTINPTNDLAYSTTYYVLAEDEAFISNNGVKTEAITNSALIRFTTESQPNTAPAASNVAFTGSLEANQQLTGNYDYSDVDTDAESGSTLQWYVADDASGANRAAISGATSSNFTLTSSEVGKFITFRVIPNDGSDEGSQAFATYAGPVVAAVIPTIESTVPADGTVDVAKDANLSFVLSESVTKGTGNITLTPVTGSATVIDVTSAEVTVSGTNVSIDPSTDLIEGQFYTITFDAAAFVDADGNNSAGLTSQTVWNFTVKEANVAPVAQGVSIKKSLVVDGVLEGSYTYSDANDDPESGTAFQWYRADDANGTNRAAISGASSQTYTVVNDDNGKYVSFEVTPNDGVLTGTAKQGAFFGPIVINDGFTNIAPAFTSDAVTSVKDNETYTYSITYEDLNNDVPILSKEVGPIWLTVNGMVISGNPSSADVGDHKIILELVDQFDDKAYQEFTLTVVASNTAPIVNGLEITGTTTIDDQLTASYNFIDAESDADNSSFKWYRSDDNVGTGKTEINGTTSTTYTLVAADAGKFISFEVTPNDGKVNGTLAESAAFGPVIKKTPSLSLSAISKTYGDADFDLLATTNSSGAITYTLDNDQTGAAINGSTVTLGNAGEITVNVSLADDAEYTARQVQGTITVAKKAIALKATDAEKLVDDTDPTLEFTVISGSIVGDDEVATVSRDAGEAPGTYAINLTDGADAANYEITTVPGLFTISQRSLTITAQAATKTYGDNDPDFAYSITSGSLNTGDELSGAITRGAGEDVGSYALQSSLFNPNYDISFESADLTIEKADLTATADDQTKYLGEANPELTISYSGFANGDTKADITEPTIATTATESSPVGTYDITLSGGAAANYNLNLVNGQLTVEQKPFVITVDAQYSIGREIEVLGIIEGLTYDYTVDWGDGNIDTNLMEAAKHTYTSAGPFTVKVTGNYPGLQLKYFNIKSIEQWGSQEWESLENAFQNRDLTINATDVPDLTQGPSMASMFASAKIGSPDLTAWDVSMVTNMSDIFNGSDFNGDVSTWNVSNVIDMSGAFGGTPFNGDISTWNVGNVTTMRSMFIQATDFNGDLSNWDVTNVTNMESVFNNADAFNGDISSWDVSSVTDMTGMFSEADLFNQDISSWDVSNVVDMAAMFSGTKAFNQPLDAWDVSNVTTMEIMFRNADAFNQDLNSWDVSKVEKFDEMFKQTALFNGDITGWDVSSGQDFEEMFQESESFNQPIGNWNLASATRVRRMFRDAEVFNQPINDWRFPNLESLEQMFWGALVFNQDLNDWDVSNITNMASTFEEAESFNGNISNWDVSNVEDFDEFMNETPFNQDISGWNVSNAKDFGRMFEDSPNFNQDLSNWNMSKATDVAYMFENATSFDQDISSWQLTSVTSFGSMLKNSGLSVENYDAFLISLSEQELITDVQFDVEGLQYCAGTAARQSLIDNLNWTIENDTQGCSATVTIADVSANEDDGAITVTLTSDTFVVGGFTVDVSTTDGTAEAGTDYTAVTSQTITFAGTVGETQTFTITPTADTDVEVNETLTVSMDNLVTGANNTVTLTDEATITILNDDVPVVSFNTTAQSNAESVTSSSIVVNLDQAGLSAATVDYTVTGTATGGGVDYTLANGTLSFATGELSKTIGLTIVDDAMIEENETVVITLSNASGASLGTNTVYTYTIVNNDAQVTIVDVSQFEDGESFLVTATLEGTIEGGFTVDLSTADGTATVADGDYTAVSGTTLTFNGTDGEVQKLDIAPGVDSKLEADETFIVSLSNLVGTTANVVITDQAVLTIKNDDAAAVTLADASGNEGGGAITITATLDNAVQGGFTVEVNTADGTATLADSDYTAVAGKTLTFAGTAGETQTFTVTPTNDLVIEANETLIVSMSKLSTALGVDITDGATVTIVNDDFNNAPTDIAISATSIAENNALDAAIGTLATTDADAGNTHTYALVSGAGDTDNASFTVDGSTLKANNTSFNFEDKTSYSVRIETNDGEGGTFAKAFEITVTNVNETPFTLSLTNATIEEADDAQEVGQFMSLDPDNGDAFIYSLVAGDGDTDNAQFAISGNTLSSAGAIDFEDGATRSIRVQVADAGGLTFEQTFSITIEDVVAEPVREYTQNQPGADVKNVFSPNGDGVNETWVIEDLLDNPFNQVKIFAQGGKLIYSKVNYSNDWAGTFKDNPVPDGTYYYEIVIYADAQSTTPARTIKGFLTIIRNR